MRLLQCLALTAVVVTPLAAQDIALRTFEKNAFAALNDGDYVTCARMMSAAAKEHPSEPSPAFVAARCYARANQPERAHHYLDVAVSRGFRNCQALKREPELVKFGKSVERCEANAEAFVRESNQEVLASFLSDQAERAGEIADVDAAKRRDAGRLNAVRIALRLNALHTADDYYHAAFVMQHGSNPESYVTARDLARKAVSLRPWFAAARWLYAAATDRYLQSIGKPQIFGTQYRFENGAWTLEPFDRTGVSDRERARWRTYTLLERERFIEELNRNHDQ
jgi:hypothetical protein